MVHKPVGRLFFPVLADRQRSVKHRVDMDDRNRVCIGWNPLQQVFRGRSLCRHSGTEHNKG